MGATEIDVQSRMTAERQALELRKLTAECIQQERDNRYWWSKWVVAGVVAGLSFVGFFYGLAKEQISYLKSRSDALGMERDMIREERDKAQATREDLSSKVKDLEATRAETQRAVADAQRQIDQARGKEAALRKSIDDLTRDREKLAHTGTESQRMLTALTVDRERQAEQIERLKTALEAAGSRVPSAAPAPVVEPDTCAPAIAALTGGSSPRPKGSGDLLGALFRLYSPFDGFSDNVKRSEKRAQEIGIGAAPAILGSIAVSAGKPIIFTVDGLRYVTAGQAKNEPAAGVSYAELAERNLSLSASSELRIGDGPVLNFGSSGFDRNHAMLLLTQIQGLVRQCPKDFPPKPRS